MKYIINRQAKFSAIRRYWLSEWDEKKNQLHFGAYSSLGGCGNSYTLIVSIEGDLEPYGMVENLSIVKKTIVKEIINPLNNFYLNQVWPEFQETLPTTENLARIIWKRLQPHLPLFKIQLFESADIWAEYQGFNMEALLTIKTYFCASHRLFLPGLSQEENYQIYGKCAHPNGHGHNYHLEVSVIGQIHPRTGQIVDLQALSNIIEKYVVDVFDHTYLNLDIPYFSKVVPTVENIAVYICQLLRDPFLNLGVELDRVKLMETPKNSCEIYCRNI